MKHKRCSSVTVIVPTLILAGVFSAFLKAADPVNFPTASDFFSALSSQSQWTPSNSAMKYSPSSQVKVDSNTLSSNQDYAAHYHWIYWVSPYDQNVSSLFLAHNTIPNGADVYLGDWDSAPAAPQPWQYATTPPGAYNTNGGISFTETGFWE